MELENCKLTKNEVKNFCIRYQKKTSKPVKNMDFYEKGDRLSYVDNEKIKVLQLDPKGVVTHHDINCEKHGVEIVKYLDDKHQIVHSSFKNDFHLRILDLNKVSYAFYLSDHSAKVTSISVGMPNNPNFILSTGEDKKCFLWSLKDKKKVESKIFDFIPIGTFHPDGKKFAIAYDSHIIKIYELNKMNKPLTTYKFPKKDDIEWKEIEYSNDGNSILVTTNSNQILVIKFGKIAVTFEDYMNFDHEHIGAAFDFYGDYIFGGSSDGFVNVWSIESKSKVCRYSDTGKILNIRFSKEFAIFATSGIDGIKLWCDENEDN